MQKVIKKIMIVVWKWDFLPDHLNAKLIKQKYGNQMPDISQGKGHFYDEYSVETSLLCPDAHLVAIRIYKDGELTEELLAKIIESYLPSEEEANAYQVMLFLHRNNDFDESDVASYLNKYRNRLHKAFLFAQGRDYIYSNVVKQHIGLLNHMGEFDWGLHPATGDKYFVADDVNKIVSQPYFDRVWSYYDIEFETKVFELKEAIFDCLHPFFLPETSVQLDFAAVIKKLQEQDDGLLWYRMKSFMNLYEQGIKDTESINSFVEEGKEMARLKDAEKERVKSYFFDDCIANLERERLNERHFVSQEYQELQAFMRQLFIDQHRSQITKEDLRALAARFNYLVKIIPGVMD